ncbi:STAS domain-containing protein [Desulfovibrio sp. JC022]|uniref:STAS domain-containing protein n=1 Tax=Desulfovibrio sp. JC022 TaxID=2593642 RepID=UPI0013CF9CF8|nr:STAS domain-containing protein [Desulfovibrio sp. JC022]NDV23695.1 STAS domain-containing protein [Desulfovibrio sp. JC022]
MTSINDSIERVGLGANALKLKEKVEGQNSDTMQSIDSVIDQAFDIQFDFIERQKGEFAIFAPKGRISNNTVKFFKNRIYNAAGEAGGKTIINLRYASLIDSVGLGVLINTHKMAEKNGGMVVYTDVPERIMKNLKMLYMDRFLNFAPDMKQAVKMMDW